MIAAWRGNESRGCIEDEPQDSKVAGALRLVEDDTAAVRFRGENSQKPNVAH